MPTPVRGVENSRRAGAVTTSGGSLHIRSNPSTSASSLASLPKGSYVTLISRSGAWWYVEYGKGQFGYCHADYITPVAGTAVTVRTQSGSLNVRSGPGTGYSRTASLSKGEQVILLSSAGGWSRILYHGTRTGYVSSQYLSQAYAAITLILPDFKQTDPRWADTPIGTGGKTMAQIGCATTGIAMLESYHRGTVVYPDAMALQLRYTASGSVYWPEDYVTVTDSTGYLAAIYRLLQEGKPVLFGARNAYGKQHWVVITGFSGGNSLTPSGFIIQDPGTRYRTNLQQFLGEFPQFYKFFYHS